MTTNAERRQRAVTALGLQGWRAPRPTGNEDTDNHLKAQYEERVQREMDDLQAREARLTSQRTEAEATTEARRAEAATAEMEAARDSFLASNPTATEADFERLWPTIRDQQMIESRNAAAEKMRFSRSYQAF